MVFDFGGGTLDVSVVKAEARAERLQCRSLGKAGAQIGGSVIDNWILGHILQKTGRSDQDARRLSGLLLPEAERVKIALSTDDEADFTVMDITTGAVINHTLRRTAFEDLLEEKGLYTKLNTSLDLAESQARECGFRREDLKACLMIGGSSLIPSVRRLVRMRYGDLCRFDRPFDAVASGAAAYAAGAGFDDRVRHAYALRPYDRAKKDYVYHAIVPAGTSYPCTIMRPDRPEEPLIMTIKASHEAQTKLGLQVYEVAHKESTGCNGPMLVFDRNGGACYRNRDDIEEETHRPIGSPGFIMADPPAELGDPRFQAGFSIDGQKRLCITVKDTKTGKTLMRDFPLVKLT